MQRFFNAPPLDTMIQDFFYNELTRRVLKQLPITQQNIDQKITDSIISMLKELLDASKGSNGIRFSLFVVINLDNCPDKYKSFFKLLLPLKEGRPTYDQFVTVVKQIQQLDSFKQIDLTRFILEATGQMTSSNQDHDQDIITSEMIRESFYNEMVTQTFAALDKKWITYENIENQDSEIYIALPALTILEAINQSNHPQGIQLLNGVLTTQNCPQVEHFPMLTDLILSVKDKIKKLSREELEIVQHVLFDKTLPDNLIQQRTPELMASVAVIKKMAIEISRKQMFHKMMKTVLEFCCESLEPKKRKTPNM